ncbi:FhaA domain-containing protein [Corynebacterium variabile]|uniref:FhaA domain-containing protein n=1 Tax=Corynebacterium variabile TaxID=1727 RepID=UPI0028AFBC29|nr:FhaA domain-containing protein [Corynebacterium variabile]
MDLFGRFRKLDSSLQRGLDNGFARVFGGEVVPAEIDELLKQEVEDALMEDSSGALHAPSTYEVHLAARDHDNLISQRPDLDHELRDRINRFIRNEGWTTSAPLTVDLVRDDGMHTGQLKCRSSFTAAHQRAAAEEKKGAASSSAASPGTSTDAPEWPSSEPDSGRSPVARPYNADGDAGAAAAGAAAAGSLAGLAHPQGRASSASAWGQSTSAPENRPESRPEQRPEAQSEPASEPERRPEPAPETEVVPGPTAEAVHGADGATGAGDGTPQRTVTLHLQDGSDRTYVLNQGSNTIGRGNQVDFRLPDTGVSRRHGDITWDGFDAVYTDLRSTNGTTVNDIPVENWLLADGDVISLGHSSIEVRFS